MNIYEDLQQDLLLVQNPARYCGGEFHIGKKKPGNTDFFAAICFPDLYEIGMSNVAVRILYDILNEIDGVYCDRVFSVAPDFEQLLRQRNLPLYTLDIGKPIGELDLLNVSVGYELGMTNMLQVLDLGGLALHADLRQESDPLVICGGPAVTNPLPFSPFVDFVYIGEAENGMTDLAKTLQRGKREGLSRAKRIESLKQYDFLWYPGKKRATRSVDTRFAVQYDHVYAHYVVPNFKVAQDNGVVEIMRGCPNGCRFCHAGQYYKPYRQKPYRTILRQVEQNINAFGFREITLSSLSSGDHPYIREIIESLNAEYAEDHVSFALPSLKVNTFSLGILEQLSTVRKSGLTFAIETPLPEWQRAINKEVPVEQVVAIAGEAKRRGWKLAKFYFMIGLPFVDRERENQAIVDFLATVWDATHINMNINVGTFIPKAHTPFQWAPQLTVEQSKEQLVALKHAIAGRIKGCKVSYHEPYVSYIEGLISRNDERYAEVVERAYRKGCRLDAWDEHLRTDLWLEAISEASFDPNEAIFSPKDPEDPLPWDSVSLRVGKQYLKKEYEAARNSMLTNRCREDCDHRCGVCTPSVFVADAGDEDEEMEAVRRLEVPPVPKKRPEVEPVQILFLYRRFGKALYVSHINTMRNFEMSFQRSGLHLHFTQGYNPKPKLEFVNPLSLGIAGDNEVMLAELDIARPFSVDGMERRLQESLPEGYTVKKALALQFSKKQTLAKHLKGSIYRIDTVGNAAYEDYLRHLETEQVSIRKTGEHLWEVRIEGERNLFKSIFGKDADKFKIASDIHVQRTALCAGTWEEDYIAFFEKEMERQKGES